MSGAQPSALLSSQVQPGWRQVSAPGQGLRPTFATHTHSRFSHPLWHSHPSPSKGGPGTQVGSCPLSDAHFTSSQKIKTLNLPVLQCVSQCPSMSALPPDMSFFLDLFQRGENYVCQTLSNCKPQLKSLTRDAGSTNSS